MESKVVGRPAKGGTDNLARREFIMKAISPKRALAVAVTAARGAGKIMRAHLQSPKKITEATQHDIKLELDLFCQKGIQRMLHRAFPQIALLGEEGTAGDPKAQRRWVVDPIDGTVNFTYGIPHACVSIALQVQRPSAGAGNRTGQREAQFETVLGVVYDPFCNELWTALRGEPARLNGKTIHVSGRRKLNESIVSLGFAKTPETLERMLPTFHHLIHRVRKIRIMGSAALAMVYVASGRLDAYTEYGVRLWDIAAGGLILECAGGEFWRQPVAGEQAFHVIANNGLLRRQLEKIG